MTRPAVLVRTPVMDYAEAWAVQRRLAEARRTGAIPDVVWLLEHPPVYTLGRHGDRADLFLSDAQLATMGATVHHVDRGGRMTWHGPGQTTGYVVADLRGGRVRRFVEALVGAMVDAAALPGVRADEDAMGAYVGGRKIGSVGIRVAGGVSTHGLALNREPDLEWFALMTACGAPGVAATSIAAEGGDPDRGRVEARLAAALAERLRLAPEPGSLDALLAATARTAVP